MSTYERQRRALPFNCPLDELLKHHFRAGKRLGEGGDFAGVALKTGRRGRGLATIILITVVIFGAA